MSTIELGPFEYADKIPLKRGYQAAGRAGGARGVGTRRGSYLAPGVVMMPSYVNIGAHVGAEHDGRHLGHRRLVRPDRRATCTSPAGSASAACSSRRRPRR